MVYFVFVFVNITFEVFRPNTTSITLSYGALHGTKKYSPRKNLAGWANNCSKAPLCSKALNSVNAHSIENYLRSYTLSTFD